ncbi:MAG: transketolase [Acidobacteria bacterium]|nr:transketolase [Acidobacteriota bacterium]MCA1650439.1 transketolase [Acidobacteriota bacterium]
MTTTTEDIRGLARRIRAHSLRMTHSARSSHIGGALSMADLLAALYGRVLRVDAGRPNWPERDRFVLSKGHACASLYATLAETGFIPVETLSTFYTDGTTLAGHVTTGAAGVEVSTGSLGHGLPLACGMALALARDESPSRVFALLSDGECDEGSTWEAALFGGHHQLTNLIAIIDYNKIQSLGHVADVMALEPFGAKWSAFGWAVAEIDGHDIDAIVRTLETVPLEQHKPTCVIAHTVKGRGVSFMEGLLTYHYKPPSDDELARALDELEGR